MGSASRSTLNQAYSVGSEGHIETQLGDIGEDHRSDDDLILCLGIAGDTDAIVDYLCQKNPPPI